MPPDFKMVPHNYNIWNQIVNTICKMYEVLHPSQGFRNKY